MYGDTAICKGECFKNYCCIISIMPTTLFLFTYQKPHISLLLVLGNVMYGAHSLLVVQ